MIRSSSTRRKNTWLGNSGNWSPRSPRCLGLCSSPASCRARFCCLRSEEHTSELQSRGHLVCRLLLEKKNIFQISYTYSIPFLSRTYTSHCFNSSVFNALILSLFLLFFLMLRRPPRSTLFLYTTLFRSSSTRRKNTWLGNSGNWSPRSPRCLGLCSSPASCRARFCCLPAGCGFTKVSGRISEDSACLWPSDGLLESVWLGRCLLGCGGVR